MKLFMDLLMTVLVCGAVIFLIRLLKLAVVMPVSTGKGISMFTVLKVCGSAPALEQVLKSLSSMKDDGKMAVIILDCGMDAETRKVAELSAGNKSEIILCDKSEIEEVITELI